MHETMNRLYQAAKELKNIEGQSALARFLNSTPQKLKNWESRGISSPGMIQACQALGINIEWLKTGTGEMKTTTRAISGNATPAPPLRLWSSNDPLPEEDYVFAPLLKESTMHGGAGSFENQDYNGFRLPFGKATLYRLGVQVENIFCCTLEGDSMWPRIEDGATIAVDKGRTTIKDGDIYAFRHDDLYRVKYLYKLPGGRVRIKSENEEEYPEEIVSAEEIEIIGRVFWVSVLFY